MYFFTIICRIEIIIVKCIFKCLQICPGIIHHRITGLSIFRCLEEHRVSIICIELGNEFRLTQTEIHVEDETSGEVRNLICIIVSNIISCSVKGYCSVINPAEIQYHLFFQIGCIRFGQACSVSNCSCNIFSQTFPVKDFYSSVIYSFMLCNLIETTILSV